MLILAFRILFLVPALAIEWLHQIFESSSCQGSRAGTLGGRRSGHGFLDEPFQLPVLSTGSSILFLNIFGAINMEISE
jgi:hypothetical protein